MRLFRPLLILGLAGLAFVAGFVTGDRKAELERYQAIEKIHHLEGKIDALNRQREDDARMLNILSHQNKDLRAAMKRP